MIYLAATENGVNNETPPQQEVLSFCFALWNTDLFCLAQRNPITTTNKSTNYTHKYNRNHSNYHEYDKYAIITQRNNSRKTAIYRTNTSRY